MRLFLGMEGAGARVPGNRRSGRKQCALGGGGRREDGGCEGQVPAPRERVASRTEGLPFQAENFHGERMETPASRVNRGNGLISVGAEVSLWGQPFRGPWSGADLRPVSGILS